MGEAILITALAGGIGGAKLLLGLAKVVPEEELSIIVNTGDDIELYGLYISPDVDIVTYTLAGIVDEQKGWGIRNDTFNCLRVLKDYGYETWFNLGDKDLATHIHRTYLMNECGMSLSQATEKICRSLGLKNRILPMTDDRFETWIETDHGPIHFEDYLVRRGAEDEVRGIRFVGADTARPAPKVIESIIKSDLIVICPSNPLVSVGTILSVKDVREALKQSSGLKVAVSPIVAGAPIKGPADKLMKGLGLEVSAFSVAEYYRDFLNIFVLDLLDKKSKARIEQLGLKVIVTNTLMSTMEDKVRLAQTVLAQKVS